MESESMGARNEEKGTSSHGGPPILTEEPSLMSVMRGKSSSDTIAGPNEARGTRVNGGTRPVQRGRSRSAKPQGRDTSKNPSGKSWVAVARTVAKGYDLVYTPPNMVNNRPVIEITDQDLEAADPKMFECLMGQFIGRRMPFKVVEEAMKKVWGPNLVEVMSNGKGLFMFRIPDREFRRSVLESGRMTVARIPLVLQQWFPGLELRRETLRTVPVWVRLSNIPFSCWSAHFIGRVASALGKPLYVDKRTEQVNCLTFARVCIEITADQPECKMIETTHNGTKCEIGVEFEWRPTACAECGIFGHNCATAIRPSRLGVEHADAGRPSEESEPLSKPANGSSQQTIPPSVAYEDQRGMSSGIPLASLPESPMEAGQNRSSPGGSFPLVQLVVDLEEPLRSHQSDLAQHGNQVKDKEKEQNLQNLNDPLIPFSEEGQTRNLKEAVPGQKPPKVPAKPLEASELVPEYVLPPGNQEDDTNNLSNEDGGHTPRPAPMSGLSEPSGVGSSQDQLLLLLPDPPGPSTAEDSKPTKGRRRIAKRK